jgi:putative spermidine/putrescine transport system ATP-binding protein
LDAVAVKAGSALEISGVAKSFGTTTVLKGVDLSVRPGELLVVLGPSGSGKTTLLQLIAGYELPDAGTISLDRRDVTRIDPSRRDIGMVFQNYALFPHLTVAQNIAFPLRMRKHDAAHIAERVDWALKLVDLAGYGGRYPRELSGGQQQRVALARASVFGPRLLLLDEPFGALDRKLRDAMQLELRRLQRRLNLTTVFITHDQDEALILGDRIAVLRDGTLQQVASPVDLYRAPANRFVADFIGESNLLPGTKAGTHLLLRPEAIRIASADDQNRVSATVIERAFLGNAYRYRVATGEGLELLARIPATVRTRLPEPGERAEFAWDAESVHLIGAQ